MKTLAPAKNATPARQTPLRSKASSHSSNATAVISAPEANASSAAVTALGGGCHAPIQPPRGQCTRRDNREEDGLADVRTLVPPGGLAATLAFAAGALLQRVA